MKYLATILLLLLAACNGGNEPPPPPPPSTTTTTVEEPPPPPPPPPPGSPTCDTPRDERLDEDYVPLDQAKTWQETLGVYDQRLVNNGIRNPMYALTNCPEGSSKSVWPFHGVSVEEAQEAINESTIVKHELTGDDGVSGFYERVAQQHPDRPVGRSRVYRPCLADWFGRARELTDGCAETDAEGHCTKFNPQSHPTGVVSRLDGIKGACQELQ